MTREEFYSKYGNVIVTFSSYYKYTFTYEGTLDNGDKIVVSYGGNSDEIYRFSLSNNESLTVKELSPYAGEIYRNLIEIESFYDY